MPVADIEKLSIDTIRCLAMDAVQKANAGHPGTAMALAPVAYVLYRERMRHDPADPCWPNRDRFVLSAGHACILQYAALHLSGYDLTLDDLKQFRQWGSRTPGHPELEREHPIPGIEITTGPLGQGVGNAVGMALAEAMLAERYNGDGDPLVDHRTYAICSDGDVMEGVSGEASSLAGFLGLGKLCLIYDDNQITIEGATGLAFGEDVGLALRGLRLPRPEARRRLVDRRPARGVRRGRRRTARPSLIVAAHAHRDRRPERAGHAGGARRPARRGGGAPDQGGLRLGSGPHVLRARRGLRPLLPARARSRRARGLGRRARARASRADPARTAEFDRVLVGRAARTAGRTPCPISRAATRRRRA